MIKSRFVLSAANCLTILVQNITFLRKRVRIVPLAAVAVASTESLRWRGKTSRIILVSG